MQGLKRGNAHNREVPTIKMCGDKRVMESSGSFFRYRADVNCSGFRELAYTGKSLTTKALDEKFPRKISYAVLVSELVNTLIMRHFITLLLTRESITFNLESIINIYAIWSHSCTVHWYCLSAKSQLDKILENVQVLITC